jgi:hypothetical protein
MKADEQLAKMDEPHGHYAGPADWFTQESGYLAPQGDQSWREQEALRIVPAHEKFDAGETANDEPAASEQDPDYVAGGRGFKGVIFALLAVPVIAFAMVALTSPGILQAVFRPAHRSAARSISNPPDTAVSAVHAPAPLASAKAPPPQIPLAPVTTPDPGLESSAPVTAIQSPPAPAVGPDLTAAPAADPAPDTSTVPEAASKPSTQPASRANGHLVTDDHGSGGFYAKVIQPDGTLKNRYFASNSKPAAPPSTNATGRDRNNNRGTGGFYAMVAGPDGTLEYRYFPSKPSR